MVMEGRGTMGEQSAQLTEGDFIIVCVESVVKAVETNATAFCDFHWSGNGNVRYFNINSG